MTPRDSQNYRDNQVGYNMTNIAKTAKIIRAINKVCSGFSRWSFASYYIIAEVEPLETLPNISAVKKYEADETKCLI